MKKNIFETCHEGKLVEGSYTLLRVFAGLAMAFGHGMGKIPPPEMFIAGVEQLGFPVPLFFAWAAGLSEFAGGILLAAGLLTRPAAFLVSSTMMVAAFLQHGNDPFNVQELSLFYLTASLFFLVRGGGQWSLDHLLSRKLFK